MEAPKINTINIVSTVYDLYCAYVHALIGYISHGYCFQCMVIVIYLVRSVTKFKKISYIVKAL